MNKPVLCIGNRNYSSWSLRPWLALTMAGIPFEENLIRLGEPHFGKAIRKVSKAARVPVLLHKNLTVWDSLAIIEYAAETWPSKPIWPKNKAARAMARSVAAEMHSGFGALRNACPMNLRRPRKPVALSEAILKDVARIEEIWRTCRAAHGKGGPFLFGAFSAADAYYAPVVTRLDTYAIRVADDTRAYIDAVMATKGFNTWKTAALKEKWILPEDEVD